MLGGAIQFFFFCHVLGMYRVYHTPLSWSMDMPDFDWTEMMCPLCPKPRFCRCIGRFSLFFDSFGTQHLWGGRSIPPHARPSLQPVALRAPNGASRRDGYGAPRGARVKGSCPCSCCHHQAVAGRPAVPGHSGRSVHPGTL